MAQYTKHPVSAPPTAPERESTGRLALRAFAVVLFVATFAHSAIYNLVGMNGAVIVLATLTATAVAVGATLIARQRPARFQWRRLPWVALGYVAFALLSLLWSRWPGTTLLTWALLAAMTIGGLLVAHTLSWATIIQTLASAFKWILGLSLALELWVSLVVGHAILPNFVELPAGSEIDPQWYWVRDNLFDGGRVQGIVGNANLLAILCVFAIIIFAVRFAVGARWRASLAMWMLLAGYFLVRASSATAYVCAVIAVAVLAGAFLIRYSRSPRVRTRIYLTGGVVVLAAVGVFAVAREQIAALFGRSSDLTGRLGTWDAVLARASESPIIGNGFASPWVPTDPAFDGWIIDHGITVFHAHNMWIDVAMQLGWVGIVLMAGAYASLLWRSWFFAVDRPRWDLRDNRPYSAYSVVPVAFTVVLLVHGLAESTPIMLWGWLVLILFSFKIKSVPFVGLGVSERERVIERGRRVRRVP